ncbi:MAG: RNA pyrophosphohydrolase [Pseudomonadota bacterium]
MAKPDRESMPYRACVGVILLNTEGKAWIGKRIPKWEGDGSAHLWQMPQGGIDKGETPEEAAWRELAEETGATKATLLGQTSEWLYYDLPDDALGIALKGRFRGQKQHWFVMRFEGEDADINIAPDDHEPEFSTWRWEALETLPDLVVPFKHALYTELVKQFKDLAKPA